MDSVAWPRKSDVNWLKDIKKRLEHQEACRTRLSTGSTIDESTLRSLDSTLKKTTAFMKKLKTLSASTVPSLTTELSKLNLSKFVEEMAQAIAETKMKTSEVTVIVDLCVEIAVRYGKFPELILAELRKNLPLKKSDKVVNPAKLRIDMRFLVELILCGCVALKEGMQILGAAMTYLTVTDKTEHVHVGLLSSLCRPIGWQIAAIVPGPETGVEEMYVNKDDLAPGPISDAHKKIMYDLLLDYYSSLQKRLEKACADMNIVQKRVKRQERTRGDASAEDKQQLDECREEFEKLKGLAGELSSAIGAAMRELKEEPSDDEEDELAAMEMDKALAEGQTSLWPDDETRGFYTNLLEIRKIVPKNLYKESEERTVDAAHEIQTSVDDVDMEGLAVVEENQEEETQTQNVERKLSQTSSDGHPSEIVPEPSLPTTSAEMKALWAEYVVTMDHLVNRDVTDEAALKFVSSLNNKGNRKRLVKLLMACPANRMDLLPFYGRLVATLVPVMPDIATEVTNLLVKLFRSYVQRLSDDRVEQKLKCVMFIAELVKFEVIPRAEALSCLRQLVYDFRGHSVDMTCTFLESAGYFLYRNSDSHAKMKILLDVIQKKKERTKDPRHLMLIENAYFACLPPEDGPVKKHKAEPPMKVFVRQLVLDVTGDTVDRRIKFIRRLDWSNEVVANWCLRYLSSPWLVPYENLQYLASALAGFSGLEHYEWVAIHVVDALFETVRLSLEVPTVFNQQAMACTTYLGELYNYAVCDSVILYKLLYQLISFPEFDVDSWQDFYRIRMVCELLNTVCEFFQKGSAKKKMGYFLVYFQRYFWMKKEQWTANVHSDDGEDPWFPPDVETEYTDCMQAIARDLKLARSLGEAEEAVQTQEEELKEKIDIALPFEEEIEETGHRRGPTERTLHFIAEEEEEHPIDDSQNEVIGGAVEDEKVHLHEEESSEVQPEDEEFMRELDRIMMESHRNAPTQPTAPTADMSVPQAARHRFQRQIRFADAPSENEPAESAEQKPSMKVSLMARGKGNKAVLKTVAIDEERLHESWLAEREKEERERADMKRVTLVHTARILKEEEEEERFTAKNLGFRYRKHN